MAPRRCPEHVPGPPGGERGLFSPERWKSPVRGPWLTSVFGLVLLIGIPVEFITGLLSYDAYDLAWATTPTPITACSGYLFTWA